MAGGQPVPSPGARDCAHSPRGREAAGKHPAVKEALGILHVGRRMPRAGRRGRDGIGPEEPPRGCDGVGGC